MCAKKTEEESRESNEGGSRESKNEAGRDIVDMLTDIREVAELKPVIEEIERSLERIKNNMEDKRSTSIKIGTGTRYEAKVYINPAKPKEARELVETTVDMMEIGQDMIEEQTEDE